MEPRNDPALRDAWTALCEVEHDSPEHARLFWAYKRVNELTRREPEEALAFILAVLAHGASDRVLANLAAGPLEDLLARHPQRMIAAVEAEAKNNPRFAWLLGGVWQNAMPDDVWQRVMAAASERW